MSHSGTDQPSRGLRRRELLNWAGASFGVLGLGLLGACAPAPAAPAAPAVAPPPTRAPSSNSKPDFTPRY
jgi:hypothetical protein